MTQGDLRYLRPSQQPERPYAWPIPNTETEMIKTFKYFTADDLFKRSFNTPIFYARLKIGEFSVKSVMCSFKKYLYPPPSHTREALLF